MSTAGIPASCSGVSRNGSWTWCSRTASPPSAEARHFRSHRLGSSSMSLFAAPALAARLRADFPASLDREPFLATSLDRPLYSMP